MGEADPTAAPDAKRLKIRKYPNRRYYDSTRSRHLTLEEIYQAIRDGYEVQVTDSKTGHDITAKVLAQMIIELDAPKLGVFPVPLLHRLLRANEELLSDFTRKYFSQALEAFLDSQKNFEHSLRSAMGLRAETPTVADWTRMMWGPFNPAAWAGANGSSPPTRAASPSSPPSSSSSPLSHAPAGSDLGDLVDRLRGQVADLQKRLDRRKRKARPPAGAKRKRRPKH